MTYLPRALWMLLALLALAGALTTSAEAQRGQGKGQFRQPKSQQPQPQEPPASTPGEYELSGPAAMEAVNRGEGAQALAYYERTAAQAEKDGDQVRAARAWHAASAVSYRLGRYQKTIQSASRAIELFKTAPSELTPFEIGTWASAYAHVGSAYRVVGDLTRANQALEEGLSLAHTRLSGRRREGQVEGFLLNNL